ncbi:hypothetical protein SAMN05216338_1018149 [Bradyrhizobium sp. Rc2d]|nr:hypothetical protein SAMN05216338_1018149 [Bradyrhizobium sp. Rc2d]
MTVLLQERRSVQRRAEHSRIPDALQRFWRCGAEPGPRRAARFAVAWAPALQRIAEEALRCRAGARDRSLVHSCFNIVIASAAKQSRIPRRRQSWIASSQGLLAMTEFEAAWSLIIRISIADTASHPRGWFARALLRCLALIIERGRREDREPVGSYGPPCREQIACASMHSGKQGNRRHPGLPCAVVGTAYVVLSPGSDALLPPSPCGWLMLRTRSGRHITARLGAQTPGARTTRFGRTRTAPVVGVTRSLTVARPAKPFAPVWSTSTAARPAFVTIAIRPSSLGRVAAAHTLFPNFGKAEYFGQRALTHGSRVLPVRQRKVL